MRELIGRTRRAGADGPLTLRADSGFYSKHLVKACRDHDVRYSITVNLNKAAVRAIEAISEKVWTPIDHTLGGRAEVAEYPYGDQHRHVVRRTRMTGTQAELFPSGRYHAFITDREGTAVFLDADHRHHAVVELAIRDLKEGAGMAHCPSGDFNANAAWTVLATIAHNKNRWMASLGLAHKGTARGQDHPTEALRRPRSPHASNEENPASPAYRMAVGHRSACFDRLRALSLRT